MNSADGDVMALQASPQTSLEIVGPIVVSYGIQIILFGFSLPLYMRCRMLPSWPGRSRRLRLLVNTVFALNTIQSTLNFVQLVRIGVRQDRSTAGLLHLSVLEVLPNIPQMFIATLVTGYLATRSVSLVQRKATKVALVVAIAISIAGIAAGSIATFVISIYIVRGHSDQFGRLNTTVTMAIYSCSSALTDILISVSLGCTLSREIRGFNKNTDTLLRRLIIVSVRTAAYTAIFALIGAVLNLALANTHYASVGWTFLLFLPSLYTISLITVVSPRDSILTPLPSGQSPSRGYSRTTGRTTAPGQASLPPHGVAVMLETFHYIDGPDGPYKAELGSPPQTPGHSGTEKDNVDGAKG